MKNLTGANGGNREKHQISDLWLCKLLFLLQIAFFGVWLQFQNGTCLFCIFRGTEAQEKPVFAVAVRVAVFGLACLAALHKELLPMLRNLLMLHYQQMEARIGIE
jgi:hypothetical protein